MKGNCYIVKNNKELRLIIIENIKDHEYDGVKSIIEDFRKGTAVIK